MIALLERHSYSHQGTFGQLATPSGKVFATVERPWQNNEPFISCIPEGEYICKPRRFNRGGYNAIEVANVPGRTHILMHIANLPYRVNGCIGINTHHGAIGQRWAGVDSTKAFNNLMAELGGKTFKLIVTHRKAGIIQH